MHTSSSWKHDVNDLTM